MTIIRDVLAPTIETLIDEIAPYDSIRWDLTYFQMPPYGQVQPILILTKPSPVIGEGLLAAGPLDYTSVARVPDEAEIKAAVRALVEGLRDQEAKVMDAQHKPNGQHP